MSLPKELTTITPLSKKLALILFISLPILGFLFGMKYQNMVNDYKNYSVPLPTIMQISPTTTSQNGCVKTGCSKELCLDQAISGKIMTPCVYKDEYSCFQYSSCERQSDGKCGWTQTQGYVACINNFQRNSINSPQ